MDNPLDQLVNKTRKTDVVTITGNALKAAQQSHTMTGHTSAMHPTEKSELIRPPLSFRKIAIASKVHHASKLSGIWKDWPHIHVTSHWPIAVEAANGRGKPVSVWLEDNFTGIRNAEFLVVYAEDNDVFKTGLTEVGYAFAFGLPIYVSGMGRVEQLGDWQMHKQVRRRKDLPTILQEITNTLNYPPKEK